MKVSIISHTPDESVCATAAHTCVSPVIDIITGDENIKKSMKHSIFSGHYSILEHWSATFAIEGVSRALLAQLTRHRIASFSVTSQRYVDMGKFDYVMPKTIDDSVLTSVSYKELMEEIRSFYHTLLSYGVPEEDARYILPNACCTNIVMTMNARELRHFFSLRCCNRAQWEIRELADKMLEECKEVAPRLFEGAGAQCEQDKLCKESRSCGKYPKKK